MTRHDNLDEVLTDSQLTLPGLGPVQWSWSEEEEEDAVTFTHVTVMPSEVVGALDPRPGKTYVDATVGGGGHAEEILSAGGHVIAVDRDPAALEASQERLSASEVSSNSSTAPSAISRACSKDVASMGCAPISA